MNRREALRRAACLMGGAISAPALLALLNGCSAPSTDQAAGASGTPGDGKPQFLSAAQTALVAQVAQIIIPRTDTPGAIEVGVPAFIDRALKDTYPLEDQQRYLAGLAQFDADARAAFGKAFVQLNAARRQAYVQRVHDAAWKAERGQEPPPRPFILATKELTLLGFFSSRPGATQVRQYVAVPGKLEACIPLAQAGNGRVWAADGSWP